MKDLKDRVAVATGASAGIGVAVFRKVPRLSIAVFRALGLWGPAKQDST